MQDKLYLDGTGVSQSKAEHSTSSTRQPNRWIHKRRPGGQKTSTAR
ncbi:hypothetical protein P6U16_14115 [Rhizobium sp. 32-5/1]|nr:hypothetical protein [Rhizobium sp. 32-5/1]WEZ82292.1 hypothetical protein P6U16_14115 [Rhizobium sp. 32-5/1]